MPLRKPLEVEPFDVASKQYQFLDGSFAPTIVYNSDCRDEAHYINYSRIFTTNEEAQAEAQKLANKLNNYLVTALLKEGYTNRA